MLYSLFIVDSGFTQSNYKELNILYEKYKDQGQYKCYSRVI